MPTANSRLTFGKHKGMKLGQCPTQYLQWMAEHLRDSDFQEWALAAQKLLKTKSASERRTQNLDAAADQFLEDHGVDPRHPEK